MDPLQGLQTALSPVEEVAFQNWMRQRGTPDDTGQLDQPQDPLYAQHNLHPKYDPTHSPAYLTQRNAPTDYRQIWLALGGLKNA